MNQTSTEVSRSKDRTPQESKRIRFLGLDLHCISYDDMFRRFDEWIGASSSRGYSVALVNVNCCVSGLVDRKVRAVYQRADLLGIDSMPFLYVARFLKNKYADRLYAPDLMIVGAKEAPKRGYKFFLYGGAPGAADAVGQKLLNVSPELQIVGTLSPPFRELSKEEDARVCQTILDSGANIVWVGLGSPKQDVWIERHRDKLRNCVLIASGATFDFFSGRIRQAPEWVRKSGVEWLFRFAQDPGRLWKRYTVYNFLFICALALELLGVLRLAEPSRGAEVSDHHDLTRATEVSRRHTAV